jgi:hypothetical protein
MAFAESLGMTRKAHREMPVRAGDVAVVAPDGQSMTGKLRCDSLEVPFRAHRQ